jgi:hypothetical protein
MARMAGEIAEVEFVGQYGVPKTDHEEWNKWEVCLHQACKSPVIVSVPLEPTGEWWVSHEKRQQTGVYV